MAGTKAITRISEHEINDEFYMQLQLRQYFSEEEAVDLALAAIPLVGTAGDGRSPRRHRRRIGI
ncbi:MAG: hypothetical protein J0H89_05415 [Rhizobiales bacterium]|nr:hypothetical protein [Hyphomicrobiales bacterium]